MKSMGNIKGLKKDCIIPLIAGRSILQYGAIRNFLNFMVMEL